MHFGVPLLRNPPMHDKGNIIQNLQNCFVAAVRICHAPFTSDAAPRAADRPRSAILSENRVR
jgi:hypothetical protein